MSKILDATIVITSFYGTGVIASNLLDRYYYLKYPSSQRLLVTLVTIFGLSGVVGVSAYSRLFRGPSF